MPVLVASRRRTRLSLDFPGALILDVTSRGAEPWIRLSPFYPRGGIPVLDYRAAALLARLRELTSHRTVVLLDYTTNGDVTDLSTPLSHAALIAQRVREL